MKRTVLTSTLLLCLCVTALSADLDAPTEKPITVRSEIQRGMSAISGKAMTPSSAARFIETIRSVNQQNNTDTDGFLYGLYYIAWHQGWTAASIKMKSGIEQRFAELQAETCFVRCKAIRQRLRLTPVDVKELAGTRYIENEEVIFLEIVKTRRFANSFPTKAVNRSISAPPP